MKKAGVVSKHYRLNPKLVREAKKFLGKKTETETVEQALEEAVYRAKVALFIKESAGKFKFEDFPFELDHEEE